MELSMAEWATYGDTKRTKARNGNLEAVPSGMLGLMIQYIERTLAAKKGECWKHNLLSGWR